MQEKMKQMYVVPTAGVCQVRLEVGIAATSVGTMSVERVEKWDEGNNNNPETLGNDVYWSW
jgi:hypothetical protein